MKQDTDGAGKSGGRRVNNRPSGLNVDCPLVHGDICTASRNVAATYLRTWQHREAAAIRRTAIQELGYDPSC